MQISAGLQIVFNGHIREKLRCVFPKKHFTLKTSLVLGNRASWGLWVTGRTTVYSAQTHFGRVHLVQECSQLYVLWFLSVHTQTPVHTNISFRANSLCYVSRTLLWPWKVTVCPVCEKQTGCFEQREGFFWFWLWLTHIKGILKVQHRKWQVAMMFAQGCNKLYT